jgi:hypothetical protein
MNWTALNAIPWDGSEEDQLRQWFTSNSGMTWEQQIAWALENRPDWISYNADETYVTNFKITGTWDGGISVAGSEGIIDGGTLSGAERTIVVTGTWNITEDQRIGSLGKIIIANGGTVNVANGKQLNMVNQARLVVLPGGKLTGEGKVEVNNGNAEGLENYNGGTIDVAVFNNNFGKFYNYGDFLVNEYQGGAQESNFYNHHIVSIDHFAGTGSTANARIFNVCQFYVKNNARIRNYEGVQGSALIVDGQLMFSSSEDGTSDPTTVGLAAGALVKAGTLYNNGTSWTGPTEGGYAAIEIGLFDYMNWEQDHPENGGYFANNIYLKAQTLDNVPDGNGYHQTDPAEEYNHSLSIAEYKFKNIVANCVGNGNVTVVEDGTYEYIPADSDFELGVKGCTPGFKMKNPDNVEPVLPSLHVMAEDLSATQASDFDFNDISIDVFYVDANNVKIELQAAGGTLPLRFCEKNEWEVHKLFNLYQNTIYVLEDGLWVVNPAIRTMVNTGTAYHVAKAPYAQVEFLPYVTVTYTGFSGWSTDQDEFATQVRDNIKLEVSFGCTEDGTPIWQELGCSDTWTAKIATPTNARYFGEGGTPTNIKEDAWYYHVQNPKNYYWAWEKQFVGETFRKWVKTGEPFYYLLNE